MRWDHAGTGLRFPEDRGHRGQVFGESAAACADGVKRGVEGLRDRLDDVLELRSTGVNLRAGVLLASVDLIDHVLDAVDPGGGAEESIVDRVDLLFEAETRTDKLDLSLPLRVRRRTEVAHERLGCEPSRSFDESDARPTTAATLTLRRLCRDLIRLGSGCPGSVNRPPPHVPSSDFTRNVKIVCAE